MEGGRASVVAPDFGFAVGPMPQRSLKDYRGRRAVLLVLYTLPGSRARLADLARAHRALTVFGAEVIAVPRDGAPDAIRQLQVEPPALFPVVTEGAPDIVTAYGVFADAPHAEFLVDRQGYLRALWAPAGVPSRDVNLLLADLQALSQEAETLPPADEHVH